MNTETFIMATPTQYQMMLDNYANILEKTNQQLGMWTNPYGLMVGILALLFTITAVVISWYIWKNSKEQRDFFNQAIDQHKKQMSEQYDLMILEKTEDFDKFKLEFQNLLSSASAESKKKFEETLKSYAAKIKNLEDRKLAINESTPAKVYYDTTFSSPTSTYHTLFQPVIKKMFCSKCGKSFDYSEESQNAFSVGIGRFTMISPGNKKVYCAHCGTMNIPS